METSTTTDLIVTGIAIGYIMPGLIGTLIYYDELAEFTMRTQKENLITKEGYIPPYLANIKNLKLFLIPGYNLKLASSIFFINEEEKEKAINEDIKLGKVRKK